MQLVEDTVRAYKLAVVILLLCQVALVVFRERPDVVVTTGAAVGYFAIVFGRLAGSRTIWIDSIANADEMSLSGQKASRFAQVVLTQWPELEKPDGPKYWGSVL